MKNVNFERKNFFEEFLSLTGEYLMDFWENKKELVKIIGFPIFADFVVMLIASKHMFENYEDTKSAFFVIISAAIFGGLFNSISIVASDRKNIKQRAATPNFYYGSYLASRLVVQFIICLLQSWIITKIFEMVPNDYPKHGLIFDSTINEFWVTIFLVIYAADILGLMISSAIKKEKLASTISPYILIVELILSGTLFKFSKEVKPLSYPMESRWGMEALGSTARLNDLKLRIQSTIPNVPHEKESAYKATEAHLMNSWKILLAFIIIEAVFAYVAMTKISKDTRQ